MENQLISGGLAFAQLTDSSGTEKGTAGNPVRVDPTGTTTQNVNVTNATLAVTQSTSPWVISGTVTANAGTGTFQVNVTNATLAVTQSGVWTTGRTWNLASGTDSVAAIQSGTWTVQQGTPPWAQNVTQFGGTNVSTGTGASGAGIPRVTVSNDSNILATQSGTWNINNISGTISLPTGASTSALQTTGNTSLSSIDSKTPALGQSVMASSSPVVIASNQSAIPVTQSTSPWVVSGTVTANAGTGTFQVNVTNATLAVTQSGVWTTGRTWTLSSGTDSVAIISNDVSGSGTISALNGTVAVSTQGRAMIGITVTGAWVATLAYEGTFDGSNWLSIPGDTIPGHLLASSQTANGSVLLYCAGFSQIRVRASAYTSGTATVAYNTALPVNGFDPTYGNNNSTTPTQSQLVAGTDGTAIRPLATDSLGRLVTSAITGFGANFTFGDVNTSATTKAIVRRTAYTEQTTNAQRSIKSANANDTGAGTGSQQVTITYLDATGAGPFTEVITLNGTTAVNTVSTTICFIEKIQVTRVGSGAVNAGIITLNATTGGLGAVIWTIAAGDNQTFGCHHYVPTGKVCNVTGIDVSHNGTTVGSGGVFVMNAFSIGVTGAVDLQVSDFIRLYGQSSSFERSYGSPIKITGPSRLTVYVTPETASATTYRASVDFFEP
jgi:hypothetical protein